MKTWLREHRLALHEALGRLASQSVGFALTVLVIGIAAALPLGLRLLTGAVDVLDRGPVATAQLSVFATVDAAPPVVQALGERLGRHPAAAGVRFVSRDQALAALHRDAGLAQLMEDLGSNPLPDAWIVTARGGDAAGLETLRDEVSGWAGVDQVLLDADRARTLRALAGGLRQTARLLGALLGVALVAVCFSTVRLQVLTQREEIEVAKLIGATDAFIRRPYLYFGTLQGLVSGLVAFGVVAGGSESLRHALAPAELGAVAVLDALAPDLASLWLAVGVGGVLGWLGAWLSVSEHLRRTSPGG